VSPETPLLSPSPHLSLLRERNRVVLFLKFKIKIFRNIEIAGLLHTIFKGILSLRKP